MRKAFYVLALMFVSFQVFAVREDLKVQFPQENDRYFLATTAEEAGQKLDKQSKELRGQALCEHFGFKKLVSVSSTYLALDLLKVNDLRDGKMVSLDLKKSHKYPYYFHHAVINNLHCTEGAEESPTRLTSISNVGREIAIEKGTRNHSKIRTLSSSKQ